ncbi:MAG: hypothetical protein C5B44_02675 [Acidobacteria bacterium]|nr:MAG: hypothetical protein C5B44_02675 [Acidobacteriota bacterium]
MHNLESRRLSTKHAAEPREYAGFVRIRIFKTKAPKRKSVLHLLEGAAPIRAKDDGRKFVDGESRG